MRATLLLALTAITLTFGCGKSDATQCTANVKAETDAAINQAAAQMAAGVPTDPIAKVVYDFLEAVRQGDTNAAGQRLTPLALKRTSEQDLVFAPPGSPTASFKVGGVEKLDEQKAVVESVWTDLDADGKPHDEPTLWAVKLTEGQWRISGMIAQMGADQMPVPIDFENPETIGAPKAADPTSLAAPSTAAPAATTSGEVARNPFDQPAQR
jgi:hypothetical protein